MLTPACLVLSPWPATASATPCALRLSDAPPTPYIPPPPPPDRLPGQRRACLSSPAMSAAPYQPVLTLDTINPAVREAQYAVRGELAVRAQTYAERLARARAAGQTDNDGLPFDSVVYCNIGNPQQQPALAQPPLTFWRQVAALTELPSLISDPAAAALFPPDAVQRAQDILADVGSVGAYSQSKGAGSIRQHVAEYITGTFSAAPTLYSSRARPQSELPRSR